jgi:hypothetical protein
MTENKYEWTSIYPHNCQNRIIDKFKLFNAVSLDERDNFSFQLPML